ncbi:GL16598 [Drosophila persimilis]|uniref:GL16598 n=1 Tax=Drosophila persimilis TaxID=7234 RepID=B4GWR3_DROPE|nr:GL16598 [Drosophila persimilis]
MALEVLVTALACLSTTTMPEKATPSSVIMRNSVEPFLIDVNDTACPVSTLGGLAARACQSFQHPWFMTDELQTLKTELSNLQQLIDEYRIQTPGEAIGTRSLHPVPSIVQALPAVPSDDTPRNCWGQKHGQVLILVARDLEPFFVSCHQEVRDGGWLAKFDQRLATSRAYCGKLFAGAYRLLSYVRMLIRPKNKTS